MNLSTNYFFTVYNICNNSKLIENSSDHSETGSNIKNERVLEGGDWKAGILALINNERRERKLQPLGINEKLNRAAQSHSTDVVANNFFSHKDSNNLSPIDCASQVNYKYQKVGENIAYNYSVEATHKALMNS